LILIQDWKKTKQEETNNQNGRSRQESIIADILAVIVNLQQQNQLEHEATQVEIENIPSPGVNHVVNHDQNLNVIEQ